MTRSSMVMITPPCVAPQLFSSSGRFFSDTSACSLVDSMSCTPRCSVKGILIPAEPSMLLSLGHARAAVDGDDLAGDVTRRVGGEQRGDAFQVLAVAEPVQRHVRDDLVADPLERALGHLRGEKPRRDRVYRDP